jgi:hypothetical protein
VDGHDRRRTDLADDADRLAELEKRYTQTIQTLDTRLENILSVFSAHRPLEETLLVITSDHGQSFGERGHVFHTESTSDELLRVPLLVKFPHSDYAGLRPDSWASLVDLAPTIRQIVGTHQSERTDGELLPGLVSRERTLPAMAIGDGATLAPDTSTARRMRRTGADSMALVACLGDVRVEMSQPDWRPRVTEAPARDSTVVDHGGSGPDPEGEIARALIYRLDSITNTLARTDTLDRHLAAWGY